MYNKEQTMLSSRDSVIKVLILYTVSENKPVDVKSLFDTIIIISLKRKVVVVIYCTRLHLKGFYTYLGSLM